MSFSMKLEVEAQSEAEALDFANCSVDVIMLDNFSAEKAKETATKIKQLSSQIEIEVSGGISLDTLPDYFDDNIDVISLGSLTQNIQSVDFSLKFDC
jgi:nicotinate-nucleotide pyrophosphorylase (carboxylating)